MDVGKGYQSDEPELLVPWDITWSSLQKLLAGWGGTRFDEVDRWGPRRVAWLRCKSLGHLRHEMLITLYGDVLDSFELRFPEGSINAQGVIDFEKSFPLFQQHLVTIFGPPMLLHATVPESTFAQERFPECKWQIDDVQIRHAIDEHYGPVEHLTIRRLAHSAAVTQVMLRRTSRAGRALLIPRP